MLINFKTGEITNSPKKMYITKPSRKINLTTIPKPVSSSNLPTEAQVLLRGILQNIKGLFIPIFHKNFLRIKSDWILVQAEMELILHRVSFPLITTKNSRPKKSTFWGVWKIITNRTVEVEIKHQEWPGLQSENIFVSHISEKGLVSGIYKEVLKFNKKTTNNTIFLNDRKIWTDTSPKKICGWHMERYSTPLVTLFSFLYICISFHLFLFSLLLFPSFLFLWVFALILFVASLVKFEIPLYTYSYGSWNRKYRPYQCA